MQPLFYIMRKSFINHLKKLKKKPLYLILYILMILFVAFFIVMSFIMPTEIISKNSASTFNAFATAFVLVIAYFQLNQGIEKGNSFFRQADVNFIFIAPISPKKVLIYGFLKQMFTTLLMLFFLAFQIPNLKNHFPITGKGVLIIYISVFALFFMMSLFSVVIYTITSKDSKKRRIAKQILNVIYLAFFAWFLITLFQEKDLMQTALKIFENKVFSHIPIIGWFKVILTYAIKPTDALLFYNIGLVLISILILLFILYKTNTDYYEDVLDATERKEKLFAAKKQGKQVKEIKANKVKKVKQSYGGGGAKAIFYRHIMEYKKTGFYLIDKATLIIAALGIGAKYFFPNATMITVLYFTVYMLFFFSMQGKWMDELKRPYIYLIPAGSIEKVFYGTLAEQLKNLVDGLILFAFAGFMLKADIITIVLSAITYMTFGCLFIYIDILSRRLFGPTHSKVFKIVMKFLLLIIIIIPGIIFSSVIEYVLFIRLSSIQYISYIILILYNSLVSFILLVSSKKIFEVSELQ